MPKNSLAGNYWIAPTGHYFRVHSHLEAIRRAPDRFGLDSEKVYSLLQMYRDAIGHELGADVFLGHALLQHGWIRVDHHYRRGWYFDVGRLDEHARCVLGRFLGAIYGMVISHEPAHVADPPTNSLELDVDAVRAWANLPGVKVPPLVRIASPEQIPYEAVVRVPLKWPQ